jgi:hypothetical protein
MPREVMRYRPPRSAGPLTTARRRCSRGCKAKAATIYAVRVDVASYPDPGRDCKGSFDRILSIAKKYLPAPVTYIFNPNGTWGATTTATGCT